ncbi:MAG: hypothetical protein ABIH41_04975, partial [Nanoarchaeota archaeon]
MRRIAVLSFFAFFLLVGVALIGPSLTGNATRYLYAMYVCEQDSDCPVDTLCCPFAGEDAGVCSYEGSCGEIDGFTRDEFQSLPEAQRPATIHRLGNQQVWTGVVIIMVTLMAFIIYLRKT